MLPVFFSPNSGGLFTLLTFQQLKINTLFYLESSKLAETRKFVMTVYLDTHVAIIMNNYNVNIHVKLIFQISHQK
jgi:hypothetical protein